MCQTTYRVSQAETPGPTPATTRARVRVTRVVLRAAFCAILSSPAFFGVPTAAAEAPLPGAGASVGADLLSAADLEELLAPIALYPDPLLANVLAASVYPAELAEAAGAGGNAAIIDAAPWEPSVKAIAKIPDALTMLTQYPEWTAGVGEAFILQSQDVMAAVQRLRARAYANGALQTTPQQVVQTQGDTIIIVPAQPDIIYVPTYQPSVVYVDNSSNEVAAGVIGFGIGITAGIIIGNNMDCDWYGGGCCYGCGWGHWGGHGDVDVDIDVGDININQNNINNIKNNGNRWKANNDKVSANLREGKPQALSAYKGIGTQRPDGVRVPNTAANARLIADRPAPRPTQVAARNRPQFGNSVPSGSRSPFGAGSRAPARPARPAAEPVARPDRREVRRDRAVVGAASTMPPERPMPPVARPEPIAPSVPSVPGRSSQVGGVRSAPSPVRLSPPRTNVRPSAFNGSAGGGAAARGAASRHAR